MRSDNRKEPQNRVSQVHHKPLIRQEAPINKCIKIRKFMQILFDTERTAQGSLHRLGDKHHRQRPDREEEGDHVNGQDPGQPRSLTIINLRL